MNQNVAPEQFDWDSFESGLNAEDMKEIASIIALVLKHPEDTAAQEEAKQRVAKLCKQYPMYA